MAWCGISEFVPAFCRGHYLAYLKIGGRWRRWKKGGFGRLCNVLNCLEKAGHTERPNSELYLVNRR